jgi:hypothetical protein
MLILFLYEACCCMALTQKGGNDMQDTFDRRTHEYSVRQGFNRKSDLGFGLKPHESLPVGRTREELVAL